MATFNQLKKTIPSLLNSGVSLHIRSAPGLGKSEFMEQTQAHMEQITGKPYGLVQFFVATASPTDLPGYMIPGTYTDKNGNTRRVAEFTEPAWMRTVDGRRVDEFERGILVLEEFGQGEGDVKKGSADLFLNKRIGQWQLPPGWSVVGLSNRAQDRSGVTKDYDFRINREIALNVDADLQSFEDWAFANKKHPMFIAFANANPQVVFTDRVPDVQGPWCTPRSLMMLEKAFRSMGMDDGDDLLFTMKGKDGKTLVDPMALEVANGAIGEGAAAQMAATILLAQEAPKFKDIVSKPETAKLPSRPDAQMLVCYQLASRVAEDTLDPVIKYIERFPAEFTITFGKAACSRNPDLVNTKGFIDWARRNASLMLAVS